MKKIKIIKVNSDYCDYLRDFDDKVPYNKGAKGLRPFVGILFNIGEVEYFAPLTSPKEKHRKMKNSIDFMKIDNGNLGAINFNNMIPVKRENYTLVNLNVRLKNAIDKKYYKLLSEQLDWLNAHKLQIEEVSHKLYDWSIADRLPKNVKKRCCNFKLLEQKCQEYLISV